MRTIADRAARVVQTKPNEVMYTRLAHVAEGPLDFDERVVTGVAESISDGNKTGTAKHGKMNGWIVSLPRQS